MAIAPDAWLAKPVALVALGPSEAALARHLALQFAHATLHVHASVPRAENPIRPELGFDKIADCFAEVFNVVPGIVALAPTGVVVRSLAPLLRGKLADPAVVVVDACGRYAISLLSGHEGGANGLSLAIADMLEAEPVLTTTTEAVKRRIVGVGCRRGSAGDEIVLAVRAALAETGVPLDTVRWLVSVDLKRDEPGLRQAAAQLELPLRFMSSVAVRRWALTESERVRRALELPAVAEPVALLAGTRTRCLMQRTVFRPGITIAIAEESLPWSESDPGVARTEPIAQREPSVTPP